MRRVVVDTGPLVHLSEIEALPLLHSLGDIQIPESVDLEVSGIRRAWSRPNWIQVSAIDAPNAGDSQVWQRAGLLDRGEADAIALARRVSASWLLTDDTSAKALEIEVHGSLGVMLWAAAERTVSRDEAEALLNRLAESSLWVSKRVLGEARAALGKLFP